jgi:hypothetical protein
MSHVRRARFTMGAALLLLIALVPAMLRPSAASATLGPCRSDPAVELSNLSTLDLSATISDGASDVREVLYVLHGPVGTKPVLIIPTGGIIGPTEKFVYYADEPPSTYDVYTTVYTGTSQIPVTANALVIGLLNLSAPSVSGYSGSAIHTHLAPLLGLL